MLGEPLSALSRRSRRPSLGDRRSRAARLPRAVARSTSREPLSVDIRGTQVAAVADQATPDGAVTWAFTQTVGGGRLRSFVTANTGGEVTSSVPGLALGPARTMWALVNVEREGPAALSVIRRHTGRCVRREELPRGVEQVLRGPLGDEVQTLASAVDLAVDRTSLVLVVPGVGIVRHVFTSRTACRGTST